MLANAGKNVEHFAPGGGGVLDAIGRDKRQLIMFREVDQLAIDSLLASHEMPLDFDIDVIGAKGLDQALGAFRRPLGSTGCYCSSATGTFLPGARVPPSFERKEVRGGDAAPTTGDSPCSPIQRAR